MSERIPRQADKIPPALKRDIRTEALTMVHRHEDQLNRLKLNTATQEAFREAALKSTEAFKAELKDFLVKNKADDLYEELVGFVGKKIDLIL